MSAALMIGDLRSLKLVHLSHANLSKFAVEILIHIRQRTVFVLCRIYASNTSCCVSADLP